MASIIQGSLTTSNLPDNTYYEGSGKLLSNMVARFTASPIPIKSLWLEVPAENEGNVYIGDVSVASDSSPAIVRGTNKEFIFRHSANESPGDLSDFYARFEHKGDVINYLAITI